MNRPIYLIGLRWVIGLCALAVPVWAGENIVLTTGFRLQADRHEVDGATIRIYLADGVTEMPVSMVAGVEALEAVTQPASSVEAAPTAPKTEAAGSNGAESARPAAVDLAPAELAESAARKYALPSAFVASVMRTESGFNAAAISPKGAIGLMQLMPATARELGADPNQPGENADAGTRYLRDLLARYEDRPDQVELALAAYNAGPAAVDRYHGVPPYRETREYILRVLKTWNPPATPAK